MRKAPKRGLNWVFQILFQHNKFKHNRSKNREVEFKESKLRFYSGLTLPCLRPVSSIS